MNNRQEVIAGIIVTCVLVGVIIGVAALGKWLIDRRRTGSPAERRVQTMRFRATFWPGVVAILGVLLFLALSTDALPAGSR